MFWLLAVWVGAVAVVCAIISTIIEGHPLPGVWGHASQEPGMPHGGTGQPAFEGRAR